MSYSKRKNIAPKYQAAFFGGLEVVGILGASLIAKDTLTIWMFGASFLLLYSMLNNMQSLLVENYKSYVMQSAYIFVFLLIGVILFCTLLSGISVFDAGAYRTIFFVLLIAHFVFISMVMLIRWVLVFLDEKDEKV